MSPVKDDLLAPLRRDMEWFEENKAGLLRAYEGQYVAIVDEKVFDHDASFDALARRVFARLGNRRVYMPKVERRQPEIALRSPRVYRRP